MLRRQCKNPLKLSFTLILWFISLIIQYIMYLDQKSQGIRDTQYLGMLIGNLSDTERTDMRRLIARGAEEETKRLQEMQKLLAELRTAPAANATRELRAQEEKQKLLLKRMEEIDPANQLITEYVPRGLGDLGMPAKLTEEESADPAVKMLVKRGMEKNAFNQYLSDKISLQRELRDVRDEWCKVPNRHRPTSELPATSVVIVFHNEALSTLLRTVHSVLNRSPKDLIKEIVLVDDASDMDHLKDDRLEEYLDRNFPSGLIQLIREKERVGLIRARLTGGRAASSKTITYLDSHVEVTPGWLEPLLDRIEDDPSIIPCPVVDTIHDIDFGLIHIPVTDVKVAGFDWTLSFTWHSVPERARKPNASLAAPVASPAMMGGHFAIDKAYFEKLGTYDPGFDIWGNENLELAFKAWMCGGRVEILPCSHVGHVFRKVSPYQWRKGVNVAKRNAVRLAEVWMDDYKKYYYEKINFDLGEYGDISSRKKLREGLKCNSFDWYVKNVYPELFVPGSSVASGQLRNEHTEMCLDSPLRRDQDIGKADALLVYPCHDDHPHQIWYMTRSGEIRRDETCLDSNAQILLWKCNDDTKHQRWIYYDKSQTIKQRGNSGKCLEINEARDKLRVASCDPENPRQGWKWQFLHLENQALEGSNNSSVAVKSKNSTADEKSPVVVIVDQ